MTILGDPFWMGIAFVSVILLAVLVFIFFSGTAHAPKPGALVSERTGGAPLTIPLVMSNEGRVVVRVIDEDTEDEHDALDDCRSSTFAIDTAYETNAVSPSCALARVAGQTATIVTSRPTKMAVAHFPRRFRMGKVGILGWFSKTSVVPHLEHDVAAREAVVMPPGALPRSIGGIIGLTFLESPAFGSVTFGVNCSSFRTGLPLSALRREASLVAECDAARDGHFNLFVLSHVRLLGGRYRFVVDTGAAPVLFEKGTSARLATPPQGMRQYPLSMSGSSVSARVTRDSVALTLGQDPAHTAKTRVVFTSGGITHPSVLNRSDGVAGLLGTEALNGLLIDIRNGAMTLWKPK